MNKRRGGILIHPTSFPSKYGIGDFGKEAYKFIDFLKEAKQSLWQILPLGHTSFGDSPYQSFSTFAGNPLLISPDMLIDDGLLNEKEIGNIPNFSNEKVEFGKVIDFKYDLYRKAFENFKNKKNKAKLNSAFEEFIEKNEFWLDDYCLFVSLKNYFIQERKNTYETDEYKKYKKDNINSMTENQINDCFYGACWNSFPSDLVSRKKTALNKWRKKLESEIMFYKFIQFEFFYQWKKLKDYANENDIKIIGDIPIFVAADSADTWSNKNLFCIDKSGKPVKVAGVPPDYFSQTGQLWGNPLYDWKVHKKSGYEWWIKRVESMLSLVDILRIDHFRGFESYWAVDYGEKTAVKGKWVKGPGEELFDAIKEKLGDINIIAEDLGDLNEEVIELRNKLGFPGMKILQFAFDGSSENSYLPHNYDSNNYVVYTGTHDNDTTQGWYDSAEEGQKDYFRRLLNVSGNDAVWDMIRQAYSSSAKFAVIPMQDVSVSGKQARMNTPGVASGNWQYRCSENDFCSNNASGLRYLSELFNRH